MPKVTNISLTPHFETIITRSLKNGRYQNVNDIILAGLQLLEEEEKKVKAKKHVRNKNYRNQRSAKPTRRK